MSKIHGEERVHIDFWNLDAYPRRLSELVLNLSFRNPSPSRISHYPATENAMQRESYMNVDAVRNLAAFWA